MNKNMTKFKKKLIFKKKKLQGNGKLYINNLKCIDKINFITRKIYNLTLSFENREFGIMNMCCTNKNINCIL